MGKSPSGHAKSLTSPTRRSLYRVIANNPLHYNAIHTALIALNPSNSVQKQIRSSTGSAGFLTAVGMCISNDGVTAAIEMR